MSTDRTSDHRAPARATRSARMLGVAARRRRLGVRVAMVGTLAGLMTSMAVPAMAATDDGQRAEPVAVTTTTAAAAAAAAQSPPKAEPKATPKTPKSGPKAPSVEGLQLDAFYGAGYGYADAEVLAGYWDLGSAWDAKLTGGSKIKAGLKLPFAPKVTDDR